MWLNFIQKSNTWYVNNSKKKETAEAFYLLAKINIEESFDFSTTKELLEKSKNEKTARDVAVRSRNFVIHQRRHCLPSARLHSEQRPGISKIASVANRDSQFEQKRERSF